MIAKKKGVILRWILLLTALAVAAYFALFLSERPQPAPGSIPILIPALVEASGLAASHRSSDLLWSHNDSGGRPVLYGVATNGESRGTLRITGVKNLDWEAISSFELEGKAWIAIGDVGDNSEQRVMSVIYIVEEPALDQLSPFHETLASVAWSIVFRFESGPHDCEALMVDARLQELLLITKRTRAPEIYRLPLRPAQLSGANIAKKTGTVAYVPQPDLKQRLFPVPTGRFRGQITDAGLSPDGLSAAILTYGDVLVFHRQRAESWATAFQHEPQRLRPHGLQQGEAICFSSDGKELFVTGEQKHPILLRYALPARQGE